MTDKKASARDRIFEAAVECLEHDGLKKMTVRKIATLAGVNSAAINYYFGTKEALVGLIMRKTLDEMIKMPAELFASASGSFGERLESFFIGYLEGLFRWRGVSRAHLYAPLIEGRYDTEFMHAFDVFFEALLAQLTRLDSGLAIERLRLQLIQVFSAILFPGLMPKVFIGFAGLDFDDVDTRRDYVRGVVRIFFPSPASSQSK